MTTEEFDLFHSLYTMPDDLDCWEWHGVKNPGGHGIFPTGRGYLRKIHNAHRVMYHLFCGPIPPGMIIHHMCGNKGCVNPLHLQIVTPLQHSAVHSIMGVKRRGSARPTP